MAVPLYKQIERLKQNSIPIIIGVLVGVTVGIVSVVYLGKLFKLEEIMILSLVPKSVTAAISIEISKENSILIGKEVRIIKGEDERIGRAIDIDDEGRLIIKFENGNTEAIFSGEVSVRGINGYV